MAHILLVDDDPIVLAVLERTLAAGGHRASLASSSDEMRTMIATLKVDVVLLDVQLGTESGLDVAGELRAAQPFLPLLIVSGHDDRETWSRALEIGVYGFLPKPVGQVAMLVAIENALRRGELERAAANERATLSRAVAERTKELQRALEDVQAAQHETVYLLAQAAEWRDSGTGAHLRRMSELCGLIAAEFGEDDDACALIREASTLHDVGKIAIPDSILLKPGRLTTGEQKLMRRHAEIGHELLAAATSPLLQAAATIAHTHHERWDGGGYPRGLAGEDTPLIGRIAAVADTYDAITSDRPYRSRRPPNEALSILREERGRQFDPEVVDCFEALVRDGPLVEQGSKRRCRPRAGHQRAVVPTAASTRAVDVIRAERQG